MSLEKLNVQDILDLLPKDSGFEIQIHDCLKSTNDHLFELVQTGTDSTNVVLSETQTAGRGRQGNVWNSPAGNIYLSVHRRFECEIKGLYGLSLVVGIAVARVLKANGLHDVTLKWPNDIYWRSRKLGGILVETKQNDNAVDTIIGIGVNVQDQTSPQFACLEDALQRRVYRNKLIAQLIAELNKIFEQFEDSGFDPFKEEWNRFANSTSKIDGIGIEKQKML